MTGRGKSKGQVQLNSLLFLPSTTRVASVIFLQQARLTSVLPRVILPVTLNGAPLQL